jgi:N-acetylneuraminic acid mutarotase
MKRPPARTLALLLSMFLLASCGDNTTPTEPGAAGELPLSHRGLHNTWTEKAPLPGDFAISGVAAGVRNNAAGKPIVYVLGGNITGNVADIFAYNLATNTWTKKAAQFVGTHTNGIGLIRGKLYISGGYDLSGGDGFCCGSMQRTLYAYDPTADRITRKADMPRQTADGVTGVIKGKLYVLSGTCTDDAPPVFDCDDPSVRRLLYRYDPVTDKWMTLPPAPHPHEGGVGGVIRGKLYVAGGSSLDVYSPSTNSWRTLAPLPAVRSGGAGAIQDGKLWVFGFSAPDADRRTFVYDPRTNRWTTKASIPVGGAEAAAAPVRDRQSHILVVGGGRTGGEGPGPSELYTP